MTDYDARTKYSGGSFAVADAARHSGLSFWIGSQLSGLKVLPPIVVMLLVCIVGSMLTEVTANSAASSILLPIVAQIVSLYINVRLETKSGRIS